MPPSISLQRPGNLRGSTIIGGIEYFERKYGPAAAQRVIATVSPEWRALLRPNQAVLGLLGSRLYPYAFIGELVRLMAKMVRRDEDAFVREVAAAGIDATLGTVNRLILRWVATPQDYAKRAQEVWNQYHDSGRVTVLSITEREYLVQMSELAAHDVTVCKVVLEGRRRILTKAGVEVIDARREKCISWGHEVCVMRYRW